MSLEAIARFEVPTVILEQTEAQLRKAGADGYELLVVWTGRRVDDVFEVLEAHVPQQTSSRSRKGLLVHVEGPALHKLNVWLFENEQQLAVQVHAHPTHAFHSDTDDTYPIVTTLGGLSLVAADFCRDGLLSESTAAFRLSPAGWNEVPLDLVQAA